MEKTIANTTSLDGTSSAAIDLPTGSDRTTPTPEPSIISGLAVHGDVHGTGTCTVHGSPASGLQTALQESTIPTIVVDEAKSDEDTMTLVSSSSTDGEVAGVSVYCSALCLVLPSCLWLFTYKCNFT